MKWDLMIYLLWKQLIILSEADLKIMIKILGDEKEASKIAKNIIKFRSVRKITSTSDLVKIIKKAKKKITQVK